MRLEPLEPRRLLASVLDVTVHSAAGVKLELTEGMTLSPDFKQPVGVTVTPLPGTVGIAFELDGQYIRTERSVPLSLYGDVRGVLNTGTLTEGAHTLAYTPEFADGSIGTRREIGFEVIAPAPPDEPPNSSEFPNSSNTGPTGPLTTTYGVLTINSPGLYQNFIATGGISIAASDVTIRNFISYDNIKVYSGERLLLEDGEIDAGGADGISGQNMTLRRLEIHNAHDGVRIGTDGNVTIEDCYIHDLNGSHTDGVQTLSNVPNVTIKHNRFETGSITSHLNGVGGGWLVENNLFDGAGYTMYCYSYGTPEVLNNVFTNFAYGVARFWPSTGIWTGNTGTNGEPIN